MKKLFLAVQASTQWRLDSHNKKELLLSETYNFRSLSQKKGEKAGTD